MLSRREEGSVLLLVPAAILVFVVLGAIAVDAAVVFLGQRELGNGAEAAANDAATSVSDPAFYRPGGEVVIDPARASQVVADAVAARQMSGVVLSEPPAVTVSPDGHQVCVELTGTVTRIFGAAVPGIERTVTVHGRATASTVTDAGGGRVPPASLCP